MPPRSRAKKTAAPADQYDLFGLDGTITPDLPTAATITDVDSTESPTAPTEDPVKTAAPDPSVPQIVLPQGRPVAALTTTQTTDSSALFNDPADLAEVAVPESPVAAWASSPAQLLPPSDVAYLTRSPSPVDADPAADLVPAVPVATPWVSALAGNLTAPPGTLDGEPVSYHPTSLASTVPPNKRARAAANLAALQTLDRLFSSEGQHSYATAEQQQILADWSGWGALPEIFEPTHAQAQTSWARQRSETLLPAAYRELRAVDADASEQIQATLARQSIHWDQPRSVLRASRELRTQISESITRTEVNGPALDRLDSALAAVIRGAEWDPTRAEVLTFLPEPFWKSAAASTLNAHYTSPAIADAMWTAMIALGYTAGPVLEPGTGSGVFMATAPEAATIVGVESDPITARIAAALHPGHTVLAEGFETPGWNKSSFTAAIGNVPFGDYRVYDPEFNPAGHSIHNAFISKAVQLTAPGGIVALLTSSYTMDSKSTQARDDLYRDADLVGAVRLPTGAFRLTAGTDVVVDVLILRRRDPDASPMPRAAWRDVVPIATDGGELHVNQYFAAHPENILGTLTAGRGLYRDGDMRITAHDGPDARPLADQLATALSGITDYAHANGLTFTAPTSGLEPIKPAGEPVDDQHRPGTIRANGAGLIRLDPLTRTWTSLAIKADSTTQENGRTAAQIVAEARQLLTLRDVAEPLIAGQADGSTTEQQRQDSRTRLRTLYQEYAAEYGPINRTVEKPRVSWILQRNLSESEIDPEWPTKQRIVKNKKTGLLEAEVNDLGEPVMQVLVHSIDHVRPTAVEKLRADPGFATVLALETYDPDNRTAAPAAILTVDVITARRPVTATADPAEALALVLDAEGAVDIDAVAAVLTELGSTVPVTSARARELLGDLVFDHPGGAVRDVPVGLLTDEAAAAAFTLAHTEPAGGLILAARYLSGNVRLKLDNAVAAADPRFAANIAALTAVLPVDLTPADIEARPGVTWVTPADYTDFLREVLDADNSTITWLDNGGCFDLQTDTADHNSTTVRIQYGTPDYDGLQLMDALLNNTPVLVTMTVLDYDGTPREVPDPEGTAAAYAKREALAVRFGGWLFEDPDRAGRLTAVYNRRFNAHVAPTYDGSALTLPGLGDHFTPRSTQINAVARITTEPTVLLDHVVGAGKTGIMAMSAMELRRLGHVRQPWIVVPNHIVEQVVREAKSWYPTAKILAGPSATTAATRREFAALSATGDYDIVVCPESLFQGIPVSVDARASYIGGRIDELRAALSARADKDDRSQSSATKTINAAIKRMEARLKDTLNPKKKDDGITFDSTSCDYLFVDESHHYKNRQVISGQRDLAHPDEAQRATDMSMKLTILRDRAAHLAVTEPGRPIRIATMATGTPLPNSPREGWVQLAYVRPDLLQDAGVEVFDTWAAAHLRAVTRLEMKPTGAGFQPKTRVNRFVNLPDMTRMWQQMADVVTRDQLDVDLPELVDGARTQHVMPRSAEQAEYAAQLEQRAEALRGGGVDPKVDNMLKISGDGRKAALDPRLADLPPDPAGGRLRVLADQILSTWTDTRQRTYTDDAGTPAARPGALQIVFCDQSTPKPTGWNVYRGLKDLLVDGGMPADTVRFIHEAGNSDAARADLFASARDGRTQVLIGSTHKMGTGANIQARAVAEHHVDPPWRPADIEQREGRIVRQGNQNVKYGPVAVHTYITEQTFDAYSWQIVTHKARTIAQVRLGGSARHIDVDDSDTMSFEQQAIAASGDTRIQARYQAQQDHSQLQMLERAHHSEQRGLITSIAQDQQRLARLTEQLPRLIDAVARVQPTEGTAFRATIDGDTFDRRVDAGRALFHLTGTYAPVPGRVNNVNRSIGRIGGLELWITGAAGADQKLRLHFPDLDDGAAGRFAVSAGLAAVVDLTDMKGDSPGYGTITRIEHHLAGATGALRDLRASIAQLPSRIAAAQTLVGTEFPRTAELAALAATIRRLDAELAADDADKRPAETGETRTPAWLTRIAEDQRDQYTHSHPLRQLYPGGMTTIGDLRPGDIMPAATTTGAPRLVENISGYGATATLRLIDLDTNETSTLNKRRSTRTGVLARPTRNLTDIESAVIDRPTGSKLISHEDLEVGHHITVLAQRLGDYDTDVFTGTVTDVGNPENPNMPIAINTDGNRPVSLRLRYDSTVILHQPPIAHGAGPAHSSASPDPTPSAPQHHSTLATAARSTAPQPFQSRRTLRPAESSTPPVPGGAVPLAGQIHDALAAWPEISSKLHQLFQPHHHPSTADITAITRLRDVMSAILTPDNPMPKGPAAAQQLWTNLSAHAEQVSAVVHVYATGLELHPWLHHACIELARAAQSIADAHQNPPVPTATLSRAAAPVRNREQDRLTAPGDSAESRAPDQAPPAVPVAAAAEGGIRVEHGPAGTQVVGTDRGDVQLRGLLKDGNWKWSPRRTSWVQTSNTGLERRTYRVHQLVSALQRLGRDLPVQPHPDDPAATSAFPTGPDPVTAPQPSHYSPQR